MYPRQQAAASDAVIYTTESALLGSSGTVGGLAYATDTGSMWMWDGTRWLRIPGLGLTTATVLGYNNP